MARSRQRDVVLELLKGGRVLTQADAYADYGIGRLAARIEELRKEGYEIRSTMIPRANPAGDIVTVARYSMPK